MTSTAANLLRSFREARQHKSILQRVRSYRPFVDIRIETHDHIVTTAGGGSQLLKVMELRHEVFVEEWQGRRAFHGLDTDDYDFDADHLILIDKDLNEVVGTYRLRCSHFTHNFYSSSEFELDEFLRVPAVRLELGRACIHPNFRNGRTLDLLWKGLCQYIMKTKSEYLFGCASLRTVNPVEVSRMLRTLGDQGLWVRESAIRPTPDYQFPLACVDGAAPLSAVERRELISPLLRSYLHAGAQVYGLPALDTDFMCTDILTILDWRRLSPRFQSRFVG